MAQMTIVNTAIWYTSHRCACSEIDLYKLLNHMDLPSGQELLFANLGYEPRTKRTRCAKTLLKTPSAANCLMRSGGYGGVNGTLGGIIATTVFYEPRPQDRERKGTYWLNRQ
jgi:hypothetical protein